MAYKAARGAKEICRTWAFSSPKRPAHPGVTTPKATAVSVVLVTPPADTVVVEKVVVVVVVVVPTMGGLHL